MADLFERLAPILRQAYQNASAVKALLDQAGLKPEEIRSRADLDRVAVTSKDRLIEMQGSDPPFGGFLGAPPARLQRIYLSPGPIYTPWAGESAVVDTLYAGIVVAGIQTGEVVLNAIGYHLGGIGLQLDEAVRRAGATVIAGGVGNQELQLELMQKLGVTAYVGVPSYLMALLQKAEQMGLNVRSQFKLRKAFVSAEPLPPSLRAAFVDQYGLQVANIYAVAELGALAYNTEGGPSLRLFDSPIIEIVSPETGQPVAAGDAGQVVVTSFNETFPLIRFGTGDMALNLDPRPGESTQGERSIILVGRVGEAVKVRGMFVHPNQLRFAVGQVAGVARAQGVVTRPESRDELTVRLVPKGAGAEAENLFAPLGETIRSFCRVKVDRFEIVSPEELVEGATPLIDQRTWK